jgi:alpha/beta superfamily hydrolase
MKNFIIIFIVIIIVLGIGLIFLPLRYLSSQRSYREVTISGDGYQMSGYLSEGTGPKDYWVILVHGNRKNGQDHELYRVIKDNLPEELSVLAIDLRGFGDSSGEGNSQVPNTIDRSEDLHAAENYLANNYGVQEDQIVLMGHSFGAAQVMKDALDHEHLLVMPIGLGDWDSLLDDPAAVQSYIRKFYTNTGASLQTEDVLVEGKDFTTNSIFADCPTSPVLMIYASGDDGIQKYRKPYQELHERCESKINWTEIPLSDHFYGTEFTRMPEVLRRIYSRISLSLLMYRMNGILSQVGK